MNRFFDNRDRETPMKVNGNAEFLTAIYKKWEDLFIGGCKKGEQHMGREK